MSTSAIGTVMDALCDGLRAVSTLSGVGVFSGGVSIEESGLESIEFGDADLTEIAAYMGGGRLETWDVELVIVGQASSWEGDTETTIRSARDRTLELFAAVETYINDTYTGSLPDVVVSGAKLESGYGPQSRSALMTCTLTVRSVKNP